MIIKYPVFLVIAGLLFAAGCSSVATEQVGVAENEEEIQERHEIIITRSSPEIKLKNVEITEGDNFKDLDCVEEVAENIQYTVMGRVDSNKAGTYKLRYTATDDYGNMTSQTATVTVKEKPAPEPEVAYVTSAPAYQPTYQQPTYQQPVYQEPVYQEPVYSDGGASGASSADATTGQGTVGGLSWDACVAEVARRQSGSCVQIVGTNSYYVLD